MSFVCQGACSTIECDAIRTFIQVGAGAIRGTLQIHSQKLCCVQDEPLGGRARKPPLPRARQQEIEEGMQITAYSDTNGLNELEHAQSAFPD